MTLTLMKHPKSIFLARNIDILTDSGYPNVTHKPIEVTVEDRRNLWGFADEFVDATGQYFSI